MAEAAKSTAGKGDPLHHISANRKWFHSHIDQLIRDYNNEFVAVWDQKVVAADKDPFHLIAIIKQIMDGYPDGIYSKYVTDRPLEMIL